MAKKTTRTRAPKTPLPLDLRILLHFIYGGNAGDYDDRRPVPGGFLHARYGSLLAVARRLVQGGPIEDIDEHVRLHEDLLPHDEQASYRFVREETHAALVARYDKPQSADDTLDLLIMTERDSAFALGMAARSMAADVPSATSVVVHVAPFRVSIRIGRPARVPGTPSVLSAHRRSGRRRPTTRSMWRFSRWLIALLLARRRVALAVLAGHA